MSPPPALSPRQLHRRHNVGPNGLLGSRRQSSSLRPFVVVNVKSGRQPYAAPALVLDSSCGTKDGHGSSWAAKSCRDVAEACNGTTLGVRANTCSRCLAGRYALTAPPSGDRAHAAQVLGPDLVLDVSWTSRGRLEASGPVPWPAQQPSTHLKPRPSPRGQLGMINSFVDKSNCSVAMATSCGLTHS